jgi:ligand-binding sensor domain-containing protein
VIGYSNGNLDIRRNGRIINLPFILNNSAVSNKKINKIRTFGSKAYLCTGYGLSVINLQKNEFEFSTIFLDENALEFEVLDVLDDNGTIYAATPKGVYRFSGGFAGAFSNWQKLGNLPEGTFNAVVKFNNKILINYSNSLTNFVDNSDTLLYYTVSGRELFSEGFHRNIASLEVNYDKLVISVKPGSSPTGFVRVIESNMNVFSNLEDFFTENVEQAILASNGERWIANSVYGLIRNWETSLRQPLIPEGPYATVTYRMDGFDDQIWAVSGFLNNFSKTFNINGVMNYIEQKWEYSNFLNEPTLANVSDYVEIKIDKTDPKFVFAGIYGGGLAKFENRKLKTLYDETNSPLQPGNFLTNVNIAGLDIDSRGNVWVANSFSTIGLHVLKKDNTWKSFNLTGILSNSDILTNLVARRNGDIWVFVRNKGILTFRHNDYETVVARKIINSSVGNGNIKNLNIRALAEDKAGRMWVGTEDGFYIFFNPDLVFSDQNFDATFPVVVEEDGNNEQLLGGVVINDIAIDGANRKWMATQSAGVFLISENGNRVIKRFNTSNSPILSNTVYCVTINDKTGEVFFGTENGIISYRGDATEGSNTFGEVYAEVKFTDINGRVIFETKANGGTAVWSGKNFNGERARTGVYLVFCSNNDGSETEVTKIMIIN